MSKKNGSIAIMSDENNPDRMNESQLKAKIRSICAEFRSDTARYFSELIKYVKACVDLGVDLQSLCKEEPLVEYVLDVAHGRLSEKALAEYRHCEKVLENLKKLPIETQDELVARRVIKIFAPDKEDGPKYRNLHLHVLNDKEWGMLVDKKSGTIRNMDEMSRYSHKKEVARKQRVHTESAGSVTYNPISGRITFVNWLPKDIVAHLKEVNLI